MITKNDWPPVGTVATLEGGSHSVMIAGVLVQAAGLGPTSGCAGAGAYASSGYAASLR